MAQFELRSEAVRAAIKNIQRRAEREPFEEKLTKSFVPNRVLEELDNDQNQLLFGRRGVGKTHTLKVYLGRKVQEGMLCQFLDCTPLASGVSKAGSSLNTAIRFFSKLIANLSYGLLDKAAIAEQRPADKDDLATALEHLASLAEPARTGDVFNYAEISRVLGGVLSLFGARRFVILIDEWAQIPPDAQPYFAEFLKRSLFTNNRVTVKIAVVDYAYQLSKRIDGNLIGLEKSADIFSDVRMDDFFVWDEDPVFIERFFAEVLYNHLSLELAFDRDLPSTGKVDSILNECFTQQKALKALCRAAEGNARDFFIIFAHAYDVFRKQHENVKIGIENVHDAAISWFRTEKYASITQEPHLERFLQHLTKEIIGARKARTFMIDRSDVSHPLLLRLFEGRLLHRLRTEWSHPDRPGERYNLVTMDYGTYAAFKRTRNEPYDQTFWRLDEEAKPQGIDDFVPIDDRRSIRRIVVGRDVLDRFWQQRPSGEVGV